MAKGKINLQAADGAVIGLVVPDGLTSGERQIALGVNLSGIAAYHLLQGNLAVSASTITQGFNTTLYTGNGTTQSINTGIDMSTQWGNDTSETFGGLVWLKSRNSAENNHLVDSVRSDTKALFSNLNNVETLLSAGIVSTSNGFVVSTAQNTNGVNYASWNFQTTHRVTGTTNHGKTYTCHYNPYTGFTMVKYEGSGLAGHEIPHLLGRKLGFQTFKSISTATNWISFIDNGTLTCNYVSLDQAIAQTSVDVNTGGYSNETTIVLGIGSFSNSSANTYIMYGWANSYFDKSNKLIGNYEIGVYQGTGAAGNKVQTRGKPAWVMIKRLDSANDWQIHDNQRNSNYILQPNTGNSENTGAGNELAYLIDGFNVNGTGTGINASGGQYLYMVAYDTNSNGGGTYYPLASDTANLQVNNALIPIAQGIDSNGAKNTILSKNETFSGVTYIQGKNYPYYDALGNRGVSAHKPRYLESELVRTYAGEQPDYFDVEKNKWFSCDTGDNIYPNASFSIVPDGEIGHDNGNGTIDGYENLLGGTASIVNGRLKVSGNQWATARIQLSGLVAGKRYKIVIGTIEKGNATSPYVELGADNDAKVINVDRHHSEFIPNGTTKYIRFVATATAESGVYAYFDNISVFPVDIVPTTEITNGRNYLNSIVYADNDGGVLYVEELPKVQYVDEIKANDFRGKNACTAWVNFDGTTTPPTIRDSYNVSSVVRLSTGNFDIYFKTPMNNTNYTWNGAGDYRLHFWGQTTTFATTQYLNKVSITVQAFSTGAGTNPAFADITIFGGNN